jgi:hypothetical protein
VTGDGGVERREERKYEREDREGKDRTGDERVERKGEEEGRERRL